MTCPICLSVDNTALVSGLRAGALVLIVTGSLVIAIAVRFALRLRRLERKAGAE